MSIGYIAQIFPSLTMTFVYREVHALRAKGLDVQTFSTWKPDMTELSEEAKDLVADTFYIFPLRPVRFLLCHLFFLFTRPRRYLGTLWFCLARKHRTARNRLRTLGHFYQAIYLAKEIEDRNITHLHAHFALNATTIAMVISRLCDTTFSFTAHANDLFANPILLPEKIRSARFIVAISEYNVQFMHKLVPTEETRRKMHLVHCGIDVQRFSPPGERPSTDRPIILSVGRLVEKKGHPYLIQACQILVAQGYDFRCLIIGGGPQEPLLRQLIQENDLSDYVELGGPVFQEDMLDYLARAEVFCLACVVASDGDMDGIPNTLMEAMSMEIPAVSTTLSGIPELIQDKKTGMLVPPRDALSLARAIATLLQRKDLRHTLGRAGRRKVMEEFEIQKNVDHLVDLFQSYLGSASAGHQQSSR